METWEVIILTFIVVLLFPVLIRFAVMIFAGVIILGVSAFEVFTEGKKKKNKK